MPRSISPAQEGLLIARLALGKAGSSIARGLRVLPHLGLNAGARTPSRVDLALPDIRPADAFIADQIYSGTFPLAGRILQTEGHSPFTLKMPSPRFARELHGFRWLRHLRANGTELASANARSLITQWLDSQQNLDAGLLWADDVAPRRLIAWLQHTTMILQGAELAFYKRFLKALAAHARFITAQMSTVKLSENRLRAGIALCYAKLALPSGEASVARSLRRLALEVEHDVHADGGHLSRNPEVMLELLADLVPLRMVLTSEGIETPMPLLSAIDRMFTALRFFRHSDGELALFNGVGAVVPDRLSSLLRHDDTGTAAPLHLPQTGFERLMMGGTIIIADTGKVPLARENITAHAGTLAFEMSSGRHRYIVNAGVDTLGPDAFQQISRQTVAHSTLSLDDVSSSVFTGNERLKRLMGSALVRGPSSVSVTRKDVPGAQGFIAAHNGYGAQFGFIHEREITLSDDGGVIRGVDRLLPSSLRNRKSGDAKVAVRFHLHPDIHVLVNGAGQLMLMADSDDSWSFAAEGVTPKLIETFFFAKISGPQKSKAITLEFSSADQAEVRWTLSRTGIGTRYL
jgi:uncharacterized heparinase superfamily protein